MAQARRRSAVLLTTLALGIGLAAVAQERDAVVPLSEQGLLLEPILSAQEVQRWAQLTDDAARRAFVDGFWEQRDPTPGTTANERREVFEARTRRALDQFVDETVPGYATDRGRVMLVYGLPDEQEMRALPNATAPTLTWRYVRHLPPFDVIFTQQGSEFIVDDPPELTDAAFQRSMGEDLRLLLATSVGDRNRSLVQPPTPTLDPLDPMTAFEAAPPAAPPPEVAPEVQVWMELVFAGTRRDELTVRHRMHFFPAPEGTYTALTFAVDKSELEFFVPEPDPLLDPLGVTPSAPVSVAAESEQGEGEETDPDAAANSMTPPPTEAEIAAAAAAEAAAQAAAEAAAEVAAAVAAARDPTAALKVDLTALDPLEPRADLRVFGAFLQGEPGSENTMHSFIIPYPLAERAGDEISSPALSLGVTLFPGTYRLAWGVLDATGEKAATVDETVVVPDFGSGELALTRPLLAAAAMRDDLRPMDTSTVYEGIRLGKVLVANAVDDTFERTDTIEVVVVATGWASDPAAPGKPRLEVVYRLLDGLEGEVSLARLPEQVLDFHVLGQQIPLAQVNDLRGGRSYRIEVRVRDLVTGLETVQRAPIHLRRRAADNEAEPQTQR
jgi:GWxTD domain-containing protein